MSDMQRTAWPTAPGSPASQRYAMAGDDLSLHFDLDSLTPKQQDDHLANQLLTGMLQVALLAIGRPQDEVALYDAFLEPRWADALQRYSAMWHRLGLETVPIERCSYHPMNGFYESVAASRTDTDADNLYMLSGSNYGLHRSDAALEMSRNLNSKMHFHLNAPQAGIPMPATLLTSKADLRSAEVQAFASEVGFPMMLKTLGLAGARCVFSVASIDDALAQVAEYDDDMAVLLQQQLNVDHYQEMTVDLLVADDNVQISNVRQLLFANGLWVGNLIGGEVSVSDDHAAQLINVGRYAQRFGFSSPHGVNCGVDYFIRRPDAPGNGPDFLVTEINARWTGGLFPAETLRQLNALGHTNVAFMDAVPESEFERYLEFAEQHLHGDGGSFGFVPLGFCPVPTVIESTNYLYCWQVVSGRFPDFLASLEKSLDPRCLAAASQIEM